MANNTNTKRIEALENQMTDLNGKMDQILAMLSGSTKTTKGRGSATATVKVDREAQRKAEKEAFKDTHKLVRTAQQNKALVYAEMKKQGITEFNRKDYERIAKGLGVLGKSGKVVSTWEEK